MSDKPKIIIVYRTSKRSKKYLIKIFENTNVDDLLSTTKRKPIIPYEWEIEELCVGVRPETINKYKKQYKIK
jgi:hypothetical protein